VKKPQRKPITQTPGRPLVPYKLDYTSFTPTGITLDYNNYDDHNYETIPLPTDNDDYDDHNYETIPLPTDNDYEAIPTEPSPPMDTEPSQPAATPSSQDVIAVTDEEELSQTAASVPSPSTGGAPGQAIATAEENEGEGGHQLSLPSDADDESDEE